jgi:type IV secretory pathway VirB4 component
MAKNLPVQDFLHVDDIREDTLILKDKSLRGIIMVSSINFALKSEEEQKAVIFQFQDFLNSLDFPIQIIVQSRQLNITGYLEKLKDLESKQDNELLKVQTIEYRKFIEGLIANQVIMTKNFYVVVPFYPTVADAQSALKGIIGKQNTTQLTEEGFQQAKIQLTQRMEFIAMGLRRSGLQSTLLSTEDLIELFWSNHHPTEAETGYYPEIPDELKK